MNKIVSNVFILLFCFCFSVGCACNKDKKLIVYKNFYDNDVTTFNYILTNDYEDMSRIANLIDGLVENDKYGNIVPSIASSWKDEVINGKQIWTFYLKKNVYWSDYEGNKHSLVTANDFVTTLKYSLNYNTDSNNYALAASLLENGENYYNATMIKNFNYEDLQSKISTLEINDPNNELAFYKNVKETFDKCNITKTCIDNFDIVGVKALDNFTLQFTLEKPVPYFLSTLTYYSFLPTNENYLKEVGINNFGTNKKNMLYNGAYLLNNYYHSSRMEFVKNPNYWDKDNVFIDKLIFIKSLNYHSASYTRLSYESGNIDEFVVSSEDSTGWKKYITGENNTGTKENPAGNNTYINTEATNFTLYYFIFNQNRAYNSSNLTNSEIDVTNKALSNVNFRKALLYGLNKDLYFINEQNSSATSVIPKGFSSYKGKDYNDYLLETYASKNNISYEDTVNLFSDDPFFNAEKSSYYLNLALQELNLNENQLPIKIEYTFYYSDNYVNYDLERIKNWNKILNGCSNDNCTYDKVEILLNDEVDSAGKLNNAIYSKEYNLTFIGLYPDYNDPMTYLNAFGSKGDLAQYINHSSTSYIDEKLIEINSYYSDEDLEKRYELCSELEYYILFEESLILPLSLKGTSFKIVVSNLVPFEKMKANYGLSPFKFKFRKIRTQSYTQEDIKRLKKEYEEGYIK